MSDSTSTVCQRLQAADQAYHELMLGNRARSIQDENGESVSFTQANKDDLLNYIRQLAPACPSYLCSALGGGTANSSIRRPLTFVF